jgi:catechol 2,3-dioxygenase-like lactoylglutathione lyase family enzyme
MIQEFGGVHPIFRVSSLSASLDYYVNRLGFRLDWEFSGIIACVSRGRCGIFLCEGDQGNPPAWVWIGLHDVTELHEEYIRTGAKIRQAPTNFKWACEMQVEDLDRNVLRLGSEPKDNVPYGPWLDMAGKLWEMRK